MNPRASAVLASVAVAMCILCFLGPWFSEDVVGPNNIRQMSWDLGLFGYTWTGPPGPVAYPGQVVTIQINYTTEPQTANLFLATAGIEALGLALGLASALVPELGRHRPRLAAWAPWLAVGGGIALALSPVLVMVALPAAQAADAQGYSTITGFWGSMPYFTHSTGEGTAYWGGGWAWYLSFVAAALFLVPAVLQLREAKKAATRPPAATGPASP